MTMLRTGNMDTKSNRNLTRTALAWALGGFAMTSAIAGGIGLKAQGIAAHDTRAPVVWDAGGFEIQDRENRVLLSGGVIVTQAGLTVRSQRMLVNYSDAGSLEIQRITAIGGVSFARGSERATGETAIYDLSRGIITMTGDVQLRRGSDTLNGGRLVIDLQSGVSSVDGQVRGEAGSAASDGRVTGTFSVPQDDSDD